MTRYQVPSEETFINLTNISDQVYFSRSVVGPWDVATPWQLRGPTWQLRGRRGIYGVYVTVTGCKWHSSSKRHVDPRTAT